MERYVERGGVRLFVEEVGAAGAPVMLLLAGNGCSAPYWADELRARLVAGGLRVVRFDYRDTGRSTRGTRYDLDDLAADVLAIADAVDGARVHLVGHSMGGFLAQRIALDHPARVASLASLMSTSDYATMLYTFCGGAAPTSGLPPPSSAWLAALGELPATLSPRELLLEAWRLASGPGPFDRAYWSAIMDAVNARGDDARAGNAHRDACLRSPRMNLLAELPGLAIPTLFVGGTHDPIFPPGHAAASAAAARGRALMLDVGHTLAPAAFAAIADALIANALG